MFALGTEHFDEKILLVYKPDGEFAYGYSFHTYGNFEICWNNNNIVIYFIRENLLAEFDEKGNSIAIRETNYDEIKSSSFSDRERVVGNDFYFLKNNMGFLNKFAFSYSNL